VWLSRVTKSSDQSAIDNQAGANTTAYICIQSRRSNPHSSIKTPHFIYTLPLGVVAQYFQTITKLNIIYIYNIVYLTYCP
jgi:Pyruvate/2-oxoacid:ferredoxin oxidoreductase gamma subunit